MHLHATALGKALLLDMEEDEVSALFQDHPLDRVTENTVVDVAKLTAQIRTARTVGYTTAFNENIAGVVSVGAPIRNAAARVHAAISIAVPRAIYPKIDIAEAGEIVAAAAKRISAQLGWEPAPARRGQLA
jgi:DNA-binding IclR family transcriptional regulator